MKSLKKEVFTVLDSSSASNQSVSLESAMTRAKETKTLVQLQNFNILRSVLCGEERNYLWCLQTWVWLCSSPLVAGHCLLLFSSIKSTQLPAHNSQIIFRVLLHAVACTQKGRQLCDLRMQFLKASGENIEYIDNRSVISFSVSS